MARKGPVANASCLRTTGCKQGHAVRVNEWLEICLCHSRPPDAVFGKNDWRGHYWHHKTSTFWATRGGICGAEARLLAHKASIHDLRSDEVTWIIGNIRWSDPEFGVEWLW